MSILRRVVFAASLAWTSGCASGQLTLIPPVAQPSPMPSIVVARGRADVWKALVPKLSQTFFVINNIDQSSGLINVSYSGDPERFIDCGRITSYVKNARGERTYDFPSASAHQRYEAMTNGDLLTVDRTLSLEGRSNIVLEEISTSSTRASVNVHYVVTLATRVSDVMGRVGATTGSITFSSGSRAAFPPMADGQATTCQSNGVLERQLLALLNQ